MEILLLLLAPILLWVGAIAIGFGKATFLIAGYNTASKDEKKEYDEKALCKFMGKFLFVLGCIQLVLPIGQLLKPENFTAISIWTGVIFIVVVIAGIIYMNVSENFKNKQD